MNTSRLLLLGAIFAVSATAVTATMHFGLAKSMPEADSSVAAPERVTLWFTQAPQDNSVTIRLIDSDGELVETGDPVRSGEDPRSMSVALGAPIGGGEYTVSWRGIGDDGHVVRGEFGFRVAEQR